ncbi:T9SS type A sorting domain-containing protein [Segetibacter sp. 3557_3]|uniref:T9SS type A sorting domain-containing protein n=1 Tax=Segetibacter sp. 3557_3 TaxID=2547429 RepID=UPI001404540A|nr:T9SS type A sorting domain-containing protein [Segetibacter sp. 3557_3]
MKKTSTCIKNLPQTFKFFTLLLALIVLISVTHAQLTTPSFLAGETTRTTNTLPIITTSPGSSTFSVGSVPVDTAITVVDADQSTLVSATVQITGNYVAADDRLSFLHGGVSGSITAVFDAATGTLNMTTSGAPATVAQWQDALRRVYFSTAFNNRNTATRMVTFVVNDGTGESSPAHKQVAVLPFNAPPTLTGTPAPLIFNEGNNVIQPPVPVDPAYTLTDPDGNSTLTLAVVHLTSRDRNDSLLFVSDPATMGNIVANTTGPPLQLTSPGATATLAQWQAALRAIMFYNNSNNPLGTTAFVQVVALDNSNFTIFGPLRPIIAVPVNDDPMVITSPGTTAFSKVVNVPAVPVIVDTLISVTDLDHTTLAGASVSVSNNFRAGEDLLGFNPNANTGNITGVYDPSTGVLTLISAGQTATIQQWQQALRAVTYSNSAISPTTGDRTISFVVNDGTANSAPASKLVSILAVSISNQRWYVSTTGNNANDGKSPATAWSTIQYANDFSGVKSGDTVLVLAGSYAEYVNVTKSLKILGPNYLHSPNGSGTRQPEAIISAVKTPLIAGPTVFDVHTPGTSVEIKGFTLVNGYPLTDGNVHRNPLQDITVVFEKNRVSNGINLFAGTLTRWKNVSIRDNLFENMFAEPFTSAIRLHDFNEPPPAPQHGPTVIASITDNVISGTNFGGILLDNLLYAEVLRNTISNTRHTGILLAGGMANALVSQNTIENTNTDKVADAGGIKIHGSAFSGTVSVTNNLVKTSYNGFAVLNNENLSGKNIQVNNNAFDLSNANKAIYHGGTGTLNASCNWNGSADISAVSARMNGPVNFTPFVTTGNDNDPGQPGFQPVPGSCSGPAGCGLNDVVAPVIVPKNATVYLDQSGQVTIAAADVIQSVTDNCAINNAQITISPSTFNCSNVGQGGNAGPARQAYIAGSNMGNQNFGGELGLDFRVNNPGGITITQLGAFDHQGNGIAGTQNGGVRVAIFDKTSRTIVPGLEAIISGNGDQYSGNYRLVNIQAVLLPAGEYVVVAKGYNAAELNGNVNQQPGITYPQGNNDGGKISFLSTAYYGENSSAGFSFPRYTANLGTTNAYLAGTFVYAGSGGSGVPVTITATDINGNTTRATAFVNVVDNTPPVIVPISDIVVKLDASGNATISAVDVIRSVRDNCEVEASSITLTPSRFNCSSLSGGGSGNTYQAYTSNTNTGNQVFAGELGVAFRVNSAMGIMINQLGAFDHLGNGIKGTQNGGVRVAIFNKDTRTIVPGLDAIIIGQADQYSYNFRLKDIAPVRLPAGEYVLVAKGYNLEELNGNANLNGAQYPAGDNGSGSISFLTTAYWGPNDVQGFGFPTFSGDAGKPVPYLAGTFLYNPVGPSVSQVLISASDVHGNTTRVTANVTVTDPTGACTSNPNRLTMVAPTREATPVSAVVSPGGNSSREPVVFPDPTSGRFTLKLFDLKSPQVFVQVLNQNGSVVEQQSTRLTGKTASLTMQFDISKHPAGVYLVKITGAGYQQTKRVILQH